VVVAHQRKTKARALFAGSFFEAVRPRIESPSGGGPGPVPLHCSPFHVKDNQPGTAACGLGSSR